MSSLRETVTNLIPGSHIRKGDTAKTFSFYFKQITNFLKYIKTERDKKWKQTIWSSRVDLKKALSNVCVLMESVPLIHNTGRQAKILRMGFTKAILSLSKAALSCKQENPPSICWQHSSLCNPEYYSPPLVCPIIQTINGDVEQNWTQCWSLGYITRQPSLSRIHASDKQFDGYDLTLSSGLWTQRFS